MHAAARWWCALLGAGVVVAATRPLGAKPEWLKITGEDVVLYSDASAKTATEFAVGYAGFRHAYRHLLLGEGRRLPPTCVLLFRRGDDLRSWCRRPADTEGELVSATAELDGQALLATARGIDQAETMEKLYLFETMWSLGRLGYAPPLWILQGTGQVFATMERTATECEVGARATGLASLLDHESWYAWPEFTGISRESPEYRGDKRPGVFHAQSWAVMSWVLMAEPTGMRERLEALIAQAGATPDAAAAAAAVMHVDPKNVKREISRRMWTPHTVKIAFDAAAARRRLVVAPAPEWEVHLQLANLADSQGRLVEAQGELAEVRRLAPQAPQLFEALAWRAGAERDTEHALQLYRRAIEAGSVNPWAYLRSAEDRLSGLNGFDSDQAGIGGEAADRAAAEIRRALELDPAIPVAYDFLGRALYAKRDLPPTGPEEITPGLAFPEVRSDVRRLRALLEKRLGRLEDCYADLRALADEAGAPDAVRTGARALAFHIRYTVARDRVKRALEAEDYAAAQQAVEDAGFAGLTDLTEAQTQAVEALRRSVRIETAEHDLQAAARVANWNEFHRLAGAFLQEFPDSPEASGVRDQDDAAIRAGFVAAPEPPSGR